MDLSAIRIRVHADTTEATRSMNNMKTQIAGGTAAVGAAWTAGITTPIVNTGKAIYQTSETFEASMAKLSAISGATGDDLLKMEEKAKLMGRTTKFSATESADAMNFMAMAGWDATQIVDGLDGVMSLAAASGADLATASDILTDAMTAFGLSADEASMFADVLAATASKSNTSVELMGETFKYVAPVAGALGFTVEDTAVAIGLMANAGIKGSQAGTTLKTAILNLASPTKQMKTEMDKYGISLTDANGEMLGLDDVMGQLRTSFADVDEATQTAALSTIFGKEAVSGMMAVVNASDEDFNKLTEGINNSAGAAEGMAAIMGDTAAGKMAGMQSAIEGLQLEMGETLMPVIEKVVEVITILVSKFTEFLDKNPWLVEAISAIAVGLAVVGPLLLAVAAGFAAVALFSSPITLAIVGIAAAIGLLIGGIVLAMSNWDQLQVIFQNGIGGMFEALLGALPGMLQAGIDLLMNLVSGIVLAIPTLIQTAVDLMFGLIGAIFEFGPQFLQVGFDFIMNLVQGCIDTFPTLISTFFDRISATIASIAQRLPEFIAKGAEFVAKMAAGFAQNFPALISKVFELITKVITTIISKLPEFISQGVEMVVKLAKGLSDNEGKLFDIAKSVIKGCIDAIGSVVSGFFDMGVKIVQSIWDGIVSMWDRLVGWVSSKVKDIPVIGGFFSLRPEMDDSGLAVPAMETDGVMNVNARFGNGINGLLESANMFGSAPKVAFNSRAFDKATSSANDVLGQKLERLIAVVEDTLGVQPEYRVVMDTGALVGQLAPGVNRHLATQSEYRERGR